MESTCATHGAISINLLELLAMVLAAYVMVQNSDHSSIEGAPVVTPCDDVSTVTRVNKCGGICDPRAAF